MEINPLDYMTEPELKEAIKERVAISAAEYVKRTFSKPADFVWYVGREWLIAEMGAITGTDFEEELKAHVAEIIGNMSDYYIFKRNDYGKDPYGYEVICKVVDDSKPLIENRVAELVAQLDLENICEAFSDMMYEATRKAMMPVKSDGDKATERMRI